MRERYLTRVIQQDALNEHRMAFLSGPRQVGKTTLARSFLTSTENYYSWDESTFRKAWVKSPNDAVAGRGPGPIVLDELHKDRRWKQRLKGLYDTRGEALPILVTGSARLDLYRRGGDSLMGRYLPFRLHPFSVGEGASPPGPDEVLQARTPKYPWADLLRYGCFPEPLLQQSERKSQRWSRLRAERVVREEVRDVRAVSDLGAMQVLVDLLPERVGSLLSVNSLREDVGVAYATVRSWLQVLEALYVCFRVRPYSKRIKRSLKAEGKLYLFDILQIPFAAMGARRENLTALHLLKACHYWTDAALGVFDLHYVRDKQKREVDFLVTRDKKPWMLVECKSTKTELSTHLVYFRSILKVPHALQLVDGAFNKLYAEHQIRVVGYQEFFASLP